MYVRVFYCAKAIFTHLKLCLADAIHNFKWVKIIGVIRITIRIQDRDYDSNLFFLIVSQNNPYKFYEWSWYASESRSADLQSPTDCPGDYVIRRNDCIFLIDLQIIVLTL